jgi:hypothetical protein
MANPTAEDLVNTLKHIHYEIYQLMETLIDEGHQGKKNALLESRLIHARVLLDFFQMGRKQDDDVLCSDYDFPQKEIKGYDSTIINKTLAHLTYTRAKKYPAGKIWHFEESVEPILERCKEFCEHMIRIFLPANCQEDKLKWQNLQKQIDDKMNKKCAPMTSGLPY